jgi:MFS family permease
MKPKSNRQFLFSLASNYFESLFSAFESKNYTVFTFGQVISNIGFLMEYIAISWLVYRLTNSALYVGILFFISGITVCLSSAFAGVLSDRIQTYKLLYLINIVSTITSLTLGISVFFGVSNIWFIFLTQVIAGLVRGIDGPVRSIYVKELIEKPDHLVNAITLNSSMFNIAKIIGPALAAVLIPLIGEWICICINGLSYISVIIALSLMNHKEIIKKSRDSNMMNDLKDGFSYTFSYSPVRSTIIFTSLIGLIGFSVNVILPVYTKQVLGGDANILGFMTTYSGIGALLAAMYLATRKSAYGLDFVICWSSAIYAICFVSLGLINSFSIAAIVMVINGFGQVLIFASANSFLQTVSDNSKTSRVIGLYFLLFNIATTIGNLAYGKLTDLVGSSYTLMIMGSGTLIITAIYGLQLNKIRRKSLKKFISIGLKPIDLRNNTWFIRRT